MKPLFLSAQNPLLLEARQARFRPHPLLQILIFLAVSLAVQMGVGTLMFITIIAAVATALILYKKDRL